METTENNRLIAEFMGAKLGNGTDTFPIVYINVPSGLAGLCTQTPEMMKYHSDWNWLMEVVEKIESLKNNESYILYDVVIFPDAVLIENREGEEIILINKSKGTFTTKIEAVYNAVVEFITWYNQIK